MTKSLFKALLCLAVLAYGCAKEKNEPAKEDCEVNKYGTITVSNSSDNPYEFYIDNKKILEIAGNTITKKINIDEGNGRKLYAKQVSGYLLFPTEREKTLNVISCSDYTWQIP